MKLNDLIEGLRILQKYYNDPDGYCLDVEHGEISTHPTDREMASWDIKKMLDLGWFQYENDTVDEQTAKDYNPDYSWACYT